MEGKHELKTPGASSPADVEVVLGDPAIVINGVPKPLPECFHDANTAVRHAEAENVAESGEHSVQGEWFNGRKVVKKFGKKNYKGKVTGFDPQTKWFTVIYEDGDSEEMEWQDLQQVMLPLDIKSPLTKWLLDLARAGKAKTAHKKVKAKSRGKVKAKSKGKVKTKVKHHGRVNPNCQSLNFVG